MGRVTINEIAERAGVSRSTVSLVLRHNPKVADATRHRVTEAMQDLGYVYNRGAASLRSSSSDVMAMVINDLTNPSFAELAIGIECAMHDAGKVTLMAHSSEDVARQRSLVDTAHEHGAAGLIVCPARGTKARSVAEMVATGVPMVLVMRRVEGAEAPLVAVDNEMGARVATEHLLRNGHRRIAFVGGDAGLVTFDDRAAGFRAAARAAGLSDDEARVIEGPINRRAGVEAIERFMVEGEDRPTGILCFNDMVALGALGALWAAGVRPGKGMAVIGFDDVAEARHAVPTLTTVACDPRQIGLTAAQVLMDRIADPSAPLEDHIMAPRLTVRQSCGSARFSDRQIAV